MSDEERFILDEWDCCPNCGSENYYLETARVMLDGVEYGQTAYYKCHPCRHVFVQPRHVVIWESDE